MYKKRSNKNVIIISIIILLLLILLGISYIYFFTDIFKSNKELFFKYIGQIKSEKESFIEKELEQYYEKKENTPYKNEGEFNVGLNYSGEESAESINQIGISFSGEIDKNNSSELRNISINYSDDVKFPVSYKQIGDVVGMKTEYIGEKFISVDSEKPIASDNITLNTIAQMLKTFQSVNNKTEELIEVKDDNELINKYIKIISEQLKKENFTRINENEKTGYKLTLTGNEIKDVILKVLNTLKDDEKALEKLKSEENMDIETLKSNITTYINTVEESSEFEKLNKIDIIVYQSQGKMYKIEINNDNYKINVEKIKTGNDLKYTINLEINNEPYLINIVLTINYSGLQSMQSISENYAINMNVEGNTGTVIECNLYNNVDFVEALQIEEFTENNSILLNNLQEEQLNNFINAINERIQLVNQNQMEELGLESEQNPLMNFGNLFYGLSSNNSGNVINQEYSSITNLDVQEYNSKIELYEGTSIKGVTVKGLMSVIQKNNSSEEEKYKIKEIHLDGEEYEATEQNIVVIKEKIETETIYRVAFEKDENSGVIYRVVINKK